MNNPKLQVCRVIRRLYQVLQHDEWACPGMLVWTISYGGNEWITATQQNPDNGMTYQGLKEEDEYPFDRDEYVYIEELPNCTMVKSVEDFRVSYEASKLAAVAVEST